MYGLHSKLWPLLKKSEFTSNKPKLSNATGINYFTFFFLQTADVVGDY